MVVGLFRAVISSPAPGNSEVQERSEGFQLGCGVLQGPGPAGQMHALIGRFSGGAVSVLPLRRGIMITVRGNRDGGAQLSAYDFFQLMNLYPSCREIRAYWVIFGMIKRIADSRGCGGQSYPDAPPPPGAVRTT